MQKRQPLAGEGIGATGLAGAIPGGQGQRCGSASCRTSVARLHMVAETAVDAVNTCTEREEGKGPEKTKTTKGPIQLDLHRRS